MDLERSEALQRCFGIVADMHRFGGTLVINWHDRSLAPERQWGQMYADLLLEVAAGNRAWFATAIAAVGWYRWRRSIRFRVESNDRVILSADTVDSALPGARIAVHRSSSSGGHSIDEASYIGGDALAVAL